MTQEFRLPDLGEGVHEGQVLRLMVTEGETVAEDQILMEVETDKAAVEIPSPYGGRIAQLHVSENQLVNVGDLMVTFGDGAAVAKEAPASAAPKRAAAASAAPSARTSSSSAPRRRKPASPSVRKLARQRGVDLESIDGSGPGGRILRADVEHAAQSPAASAASTSAPAPNAAPAAIAVPPPPPAPVAPGTIPDGTPGRDALGDFVRVPMGVTRKAIADVMTRAWQTIPHVTDCDDADVTALNDLRRGYNAGVPKEQKLGMLPLVIRAVAVALTRHPLFNASYDDETREVVYRRGVNIAVGVQTERGLTAPVLRGCEALSVTAINQQLAALITKARDGRLTREDNAGATYTISNAGAMGGSRYATPIITPPQVAVLAVGMSREQPWCVDGAIKPRLIMPLSHSMDHRVIDGAEEIAFIRDVIGMLEHPGRMLL